MANVWVLWACEFTAPVNYCCFIVQLSGSSSVSKNPSILLQGPYVWKSAQLSYKKMVYKPRTEAYTSHDMPVFKYANMSCMILNSNKNV